MSDPPPTPSPAPAQTPWPWLAAVVVLGIGAYLGYHAAYQSSVGGLGGTLGAGFITFAIGALVVIAGLVGVLNALRPAGRGRVASIYSFAAAALVATGAAGGSAAVPAFDLGYHPPVVLQARAEASIVLDGLPAFEPRANGRADCESVPDGTDVERVVALSLGTLNAGLLRADVTLPVPGVSSGYLSLSIDAADLPEGSFTPTRESLELVIDSSSDGATGSLRFEGAALRVDPVMGSPPGEWAATLTGELSWACGTWFAPDATPPVTVAATVTLNLAGVDWVADPRGQGNCEFEADGSVWVFASDQVGLLQDWPMTVNLDLGGDPRAGDEVRLQLGVDTAARASSASLPSGNLLAATSGSIVYWADLVTIDEISDGGLSGRLAFVELAREGRPNLAWPATLTGDLSWECG